MNANVFKMIAGFFAVPLLWLVWTIASGSFDGRAIPDAFFWIILPFGSLTVLFLWLDRSQNKKR